MNNNDNIVISKEKKEELKAKLEVLDDDDIEDIINGEIDKGNIAMTFMDIVSIFVSVSVIMIPLSLVIMIWYGVSIGFKILLTCLCVFVALTVLQGFLDKYIVECREDLIVLLDVIKEMTVELEDDENDDYQKDYWECD